MAITYDPIASTTLTGSASSITFSSIASSWTDLRLVIVTKSATTGPNTNLRFNSDTGTNYSRVVLFGSGSTATSATETNYSNMVIDLNGTTTAQPTFIACDIFSYAGSGYKTVFGESSEDLNGSGIVARQAGLWRSTSAITSIEVRNTGFTTGTIATLYGILKA